jgi:peptidoglycan/xylan/chitin deacetylase (PgdA/CDA1 family)
VAGPPAHIAQRRERQRARRRRRRIALFGGGALVIALLLGVLADALAGGGAPARKSPSATRTAIPVVRNPAPRRRPSRTDAIGNGRIERLIRLRLPIYCAGRRGHEVAFTFDDGPGPYTLLAIKKLKEAHERATFFVVGRNIPLYPGYLRRELKVAAIGDHTYTHPELTLLPASTVTYELRRTASSIEANSGERVDLFRPPYELHNATVDRIAHQLGLLEILWSVDSADSLGANWAQIIQNVTAGLRPGAIILMHENRGQTIRALTTLLPLLHRRHLRSVSLPELFASDPPSVAQVRHGVAGCGRRSSSGRGSGS